MRDVEEQVVDELLREHLRGELEGQVGGAAARFREVVWAERREKRRRWMICGGSAVAAAAAVVVVLMVVQGMQRTGGGVSGRGEEMVAKGQDESIEFERAVGWRTVDDGVVFVGEDLPMRQMRRQVMEYVQWYDPEQRATIEMAMPREEVILVKLNKY